MTKKHQLELLIESISFHQLHLQKMYEQQSDENIKQQIQYKHEDLSIISKMLIVEMDRYVKEIKQL